MIEIYQSRENIVTLLHPISQICVLNIIMIYYSN